jgi:hypothetical protein
MILVPLAVFFAVPGNAHVQYNDQQRRTILRWFWKTCFYRRYSRQPQQLIQEDIQEIIKLKQRQTSLLGEFTVAVGADFFKFNTFRISSVRTKAFVLMLAQQSPLSFISGSPITLSDALRDHNRNEFHHLFPRSYLKASSQDGYNNSCLANFCFLSQVDNNQLGGHAPSVYRELMPAAETQILQRALCPASLFADDYTQFVDERSELLAQEAARLML